MAAGVHLVRAGIYIDDMVHFAMSSARRLAAISRLGLSMNFPASKTGTKSSMLRSEDMGKPGACVSIRESAGPM